jgi:Na+-transporting methylmalonyl-CoA/oxaloacetate decarboxylase gamma subunit
MSDLSIETKEPSDPKVLFSALGWLGVIFIFLFILAVAYLPNRSVSAEEINVEERYEILNTVNAEQASLYSATEWINQGEGVVRIPVEDAMRLTVEELREKQLPDAVP